MSIYKSWPIRDKYVFTRVVVVTWCLIEAVLHLERPTHWCTSTTRWLNQSRTDCKTKQSRKFEKLIFKFNFQASALKSKYWTLKIKLPLKNYIIFFLPEEPGSLVPWHPVCQTVEHSSSQSDPSWTNQRRVLVCVNQWEESFTCPCEVSTQYHPPLLHTPTISTLQHEHPLANLV